MKTTTSMEIKIEISAIEVNQIISDYFTTTRTIPTKKPIKIEYTHQSKEGPIDEYEGCDIVVKYEGT